MGQRIAVLGFAFKADTGDTRESAAITLIRDFFAERAVINIYDPQVEHAQVWADLAEAIPSSPVEASTSHTVCCLLFPLTLSATFFLPAIVCCGQSRSR